MKSTYVITCRTCGREYVLNLEDEAVERWQNGELIQNCFPKLKPAERELMISRICGICFDEMFSAMFEDDDDEDEELTIEWGD